MKSTEAKPGKPIVMKLKENEEDEVMQWLNMQDLYSDSIRYLIQKEIAENGLRNLQSYIPRNRTIESIKGQLASVSPQLTTVRYIPELQPYANQSSPLQSAPVVHRDPVESKQERVVQAVNDNEALYQSSKQEIHKLHQEDAYTSHSHSSDFSVTKPAISSEKDYNEKIQTDESITEGTQKRKAQKKYSSDVTNSFAN